MGNTFRKDKHDKIRNESLHKKEAWFRCRCERCVGKNKIADKIAEKELKQQIKTDEYNFKQNGEFIQDIDDPYYNSKNRKHGELQDSTSN